MTTSGPEDAQALYGRPALDQAGEEIGEIEAVYLDSETNRPEWAAVRTGRTETSLAPLAGAVVTDAGVQLTVDRRLVLGAPVGDDSGSFPEQLAEEQEAELYHYYSIDYTAGPTSDRPSDRRMTLADRVRGLFDEKEG